MIRNVERKEFYDTDALMAEAYIESVALYVQNKFLSHIGGNPEWVDEPEILQNYEWRKLMTLSLRMMKELVLAQGKNIEGLENLTPLSDYEKVDLLKEFVKRKAYQLIDLLLQKNGDEYFKQYVTMHPYKAIDDLNPEFRKGPKEWFLFIVKEFEPAEEI